MKRILMTGVAIAALTSMASAADLGVHRYTKAPAPVAPVYNWTGFYAGAHLGGAANANSSVDLFSDLIPMVSSIPGSSRGNSGSFLGGGQIGADYQFSPNFLIGVEGQISGLANNERTFSYGGADLARDRSDWLASVTGRLGYVSGPALFYVKGGVAFRDNNGFSPSDYVQQVLVPSGVSFTVDRKQTGYTVGGGLEYMFAPAWSAKAEYQYYNFGTTAASADLSGLALFGVRYRDEIHTVKAGINYHFNWGGPVAARY